MKKLYKSYIREKRKNGYRRNKTRGSLEEMRRIEEVRGKVENSMIEPIETRRIEVVSL